jgi:hypothetical protein
VKTTLMIVFMEHVSITQHALILLPITVVYVHLDSLVMTAQSASTIVKTMPAKMEQHATMDMEIIHVLVRLGLLVTVVRPTLMIVLIMPARMEQVVWTR